MSRRAHRPKALQLTLAALALAMLATPAFAQPDATVSLADRLAGAMPGSTVVLPAGTFAGGVKLPPGVSLRGAGMDRTIIDASQADIGLSVVGGKDATVSDLTIRGARQIDLQLKDAHHPLVSRVRLTASMTGLVSAGVKNGQIENCLGDSNRYGFVIGGGQNNVIVNCTAADDSSLGLSFPSGSHTVAFNNCIAHSATGIYLGTCASDIQVDYNLYAAMFVGKMEGQVGRKMMGEWTSLSGQDAHSVEGSVQFHDSAAGDFRAVNVLPWSPDRTATNAWGQARFQGITAPNSDCAGNAYGVTPDVGCYQTHAAAPRPADATFTIKSGAGISSAGIFTQSGREVAYLFHNLPLSAGEHSFWFPSRDFEGRTIPPGHYEVRVTESALNWQYLGMIGNTGLETPIGATAAVGTAKVAFDDNGQLLTACDGWAENFVNMRGYDAKTGAWHWAFHAPADVRGLTAGADGAAYALRRTGNQERLTRVDPHTGKISPWPKLNTGERYLHTGAQATGLAELDGKLFFTDTAAGKVYASAADDPSFNPIATLPGAASIAADAAHHLLWLLGEGGKIVAMNPDG